MSKIRMPTCGERARARLPWATACFCVLQGMLCSCAAIAAGEVTGLLSLPANQCVQVLQAV
jgi:hypothetical protein